MSLICRSVAISLSSLPCSFYQRIGGHPLLAAHQHRGIGHASRVALTDRLEFRPLHQIDFQILGDDLQTYRSPLRSDFGLEHL